jgi:transposase InsO family protein
VAVAIDHFSRAVVGFAVFAERPTSAEVQRFLGRAARRAGDPPKYVIADKGRQFWCQSFKGWCRRRGIRARFGAAGKRGSIAVVERFIRPMKNEHTRRVLVPLVLAAMRREISLYVAWYNEHRPQMALLGRTPSEIFFSTQPAKTEPRLEPRPKWPPMSPCTSPQMCSRATCSAQLQLVIGYLGGRKHLPVVELRWAA